MASDFRKHARERSVAYSKKATEKQQEFLATLLNEVGFGTRLSRNDYLSWEMEREIKYLDELTIDEAKRIIDALMERRDRNKSQRHEYGHEPED